MGLDQYVRAYPADPKHSDLAPAYTVVNDGDGEYRKLDHDGEEVHYFRKHANLEGWMERLWREKGGEGTFNCEYVRLTSDDLDRLEADNNGDALPHTTGFFFGASMPEDKEDTKAMIEKARAVIAEGKEVYYSSWW